MTDIQVKDYVDDPSVTSTEIVHVSGAPATLFAADNPRGTVARATEVATALAQVIETRKLYQTIRGRKHVYVEGWTLLGTMLGVFPVVEWTRKTEDGWEARVSATTLDGRIVGSAEAMCSKAETRWRTADEYAIRSMAQTRATSKALRLPLGFVMTLAGYDATPEEEIPSDKPAEEPISEASVNSLLQLLPQAEFFDPEHWGLDAVLGTASRVFGRKIKSISDLNEKEAIRIIEGASKTVADGVKLYEKDALQPVEDAEVIEEGAGNA